MRLSCWWRSVAIAASLALGLTGSVKAVDSAARYGEQNESYYSSDNDDMLRRIYERMEQQQREIESLRSQISSQGRSVQAIEAGMTHASTDLSAHPGDCKSGLVRMDCIRKPTHKWRGRLFMDHIMYEDPAALGLDRENETGFDTARIGVEGFVFETVQYKIEVEFEGTEVDYKDVYLEYKYLPIGNVRVGHFKEPMSLEELTSSRFLTFMERSIAHNAFIPQRNFGFMAYDYVRENENLSWFVGAFRGDFDDSPTGRGTEIEDEGDWTFTGRVAWLPYYDEPSDGRYLVHVGGSYSYRTTANMEDGVHEIRFRARPELGSQNEFVDGRIAGDKNWSLAGLEAAVVWGAASVQTEFYAADPGGFADLNGGYIQASYFLTGEHRGYKRSAKAFDRVKPLENAFWVSTCDGPCFGKGAWQLKARYSWVDLNGAVDVIDNDGSPGFQDNFSFGVNWYLNPYSRIMLDYVHEDIDLVSGAQGSADNVGVRFQVDW